MSKRPAPVSVTDLLADAPVSAGVARAHSLLREEVYVRLRGWILNGRLAPETRLRDREIAEALGVSRTPVREAIRRLQDERLVTAEASRWTKVAALDVGAADRVYPIVWTLERLAIERAAAWDEDRLSALRAANERLARALDAEDAMDASEADTDFHRVIVDAAENPELAELIADLKMGLRRIEVVYFGGTATAKRSVDEHARVIAALERGDSAAAAGEIEGNWRASLARLHERVAAR